MWNYHICDYIIGRHVIIYNISRYLGVIILTVKWYLIFITKYKIINILLGIGFNFKWTKEDSKAYTYYIYIFFYLMNNRGYSRYGKLCIVIWSFVQSKMIYLHKWLTPCF